MGRPTIYTDELKTDICVRIAMGESLRSICRDDSMPAMSSVFSWLQKYDEFSEQYEKACVERTEMLIEDILDIADKSDPNHAAKTRVQVDARKWIASKMKPKKYGESSEPERKVVPFNVYTNLESE